MRQIEGKTKHETAAVVRALSEPWGKGGEYVHLGATSSDISDPATPPQVKEALKLTMKRLNERGQTLLLLTEKHVDTLCI